MSPRPDDDMRNIFTVTSWRCVWRPLNIFSSEGDKKARVSIGGHGHVCGRLYVSLSIFIHIGFPVVPGIGDDSSQAVYSGCLGM